MLLTLKDLGITRGQPLFANLSLTIGKDDRIGLVAANGRGKSTLLRCLAGSADPTTGDITRARGLHTAHVEQDVPAALRTRTLHDAVLSALAPDQAETEGWRVDIVLDDLEVPAELRHKPVGTLSGGWQRMALLARAWVTDPDLLLIDEPTNHLDLGRIGFLQRWLVTVAKGTPFVLASHDRAFLDATTNRTLFLRDGTSPLFALPYTRARAALATADAAEERRFGNDMKHAAQLRRQAAKLKNIGINSGSDLLVIKTRQLQDRADKLEESARPAHQERSAGAIRLANSGTHAKALVNLDDAAITTPDGRLLYKTGKIWINRGDRIVLLGRNGTGKTQLMARVERAITTGAVDAIRAAPTLVLGASEQSLAQLDADASPLAAITRRFDVGDQRARTLLAGAGIAIDLQTARMAVLSGGQKARLAMLVLRLTEPNFYLLDEPTNHLDIPGQEALETEMIATGATCLFVSHDRAFVRQVANRFWQIDGRRLVEADSPEGFFRDMLG